MYALNPPNIISYNLFPLLLQIVTSSYTDLQDYTYYFVPAPWLSVKLLRLLQNYTPPGISLHAQFMLDRLDMIMRRTFLHEI